MFGYITLAKVRSDFVYKAVTDLHCFAIDLQFIHRDLFANGRFAL